VESKRRLQRQTDGAAAAAAAAAAVAAAYLSGAVTLFRPSSALLPRSKTPPAVLDLPRSPGYWIS